MNWLNRNAGAVEAGAAVLTAFIALGALFAIKYQLDASDRVQRAQSARDAYRSHLALASNKPEFADPQDACGLMKGGRSVSYEAFVDHLLYSAEQMLEVETGWQPTFIEALKPHSVYMCSRNGPKGGTLLMSALIESFQTDVCKPDLACE